jgi:hypothetical protein
MWQQFSVALHLGILLTGALFLGLSIWMTIHGRQQPVSAGNTVLIMGIFGCLISATMILVSAGFVAHFLMNQDRLSDRTLISVGPREVDVFDIDGAPRLQISRDRAHGVRLVSAVMFADSDWKRHEANRLLANLIQLQLLVHGDGGIEPIPVITIKATGLYPLLIRHAKHFAQRNGIAYESVKLRRHELPSFTEWEQASKTVSREPGYAALGTPRS